MSHHRGPRVLMSSTDADALLNIFPTGIEATYKQLETINAVDKIVRGPFYILGNTVYLIFDFVEHSVEITRSDLTPHSTMAASQAE